MRRRNFLKSAAGAAALTASPLAIAMTQQTTGADRLPQAASLVGTWKLVRVMARTTDGSVRPSPYGPEGLGILSLTADGRMMAMLGDGRRAVPQGVERRFVSYCGNFSFNGTSLVTHVDGSSTPLTPIGSDQVRSIRMEGDLLVLSPPPAMIDGVLEYRDAFWQKISELSA